MAEALYRRRGAPAAPGFTLIEVMVALVILSMVAGGALGFMSQSARLAAAAQDRLFASALADNLMVVRMVSAAPLEAGENAFQEDYAGRLWDCIETTTPVGVADLVRVDIAVRRAGETQVLATVSTLRGGP